MFFNQKGLSRSQFWIIILAQAIIYLSIWLWDEYVASYISIIFPVMIFIILLLALIADWIEPSKIPGWYYRLMIVSMIIPLIIGIIFYYINDGRIGWLME